MSPTLTSEKLIYSSDPDAVSRLVKVLFAYLSARYRLISTIASFSIPRQIMKARGMIEASGSFVEILGIDYSTALNA